MSYTLSLYRQDCQALLRDSLGIFVPLAQLDRWINQARREAARRTSCIRLLVCGKSQYGASAMAGFAVPGAMVPGSLPDSLPASGSMNLFQTIPQVESYPFAFGARFMQGQYAGVDDITDVVDCAIAWGAATYRPVLNWAPWEEMQGYMRAWNVLNSAFPLWWSTQGDGQNQVLYLWPTPVQAMEMEWDVIALPKPLYTDDDFEILPENFSIGIKFGAAALSYVNTRPAQAQIMQMQFLDALGVGRVASDYGKSSSLYMDY